jgi:hypothetical protein
MAEAAASGSLGTSASWLAGLIVVAGFLMIVLLPILSRCLGEVNPTTAAAVVWQVAGMADLVSQAHRGGPIDRDILSQRPEGAALEAPDRVDGEHEDG